LKIKQAPPPFAEVVATVDVVVRVVDVIVLVVVSGRSVVSTFTTPFSSNWSET